MANQVTGISTVPASGSAVNAGKTVVFTLTTQQPVLVTGQPQLTLNDGGVATYSGRGPNGNPQFTYTVAAGQNTSDLKVTGYAANGGSIQTSGAFSLAPRKNIDVGAIPFAVASADLNHDGNADIITANNNSNNISVLLGNGNATFKTTSFYTTGRVPSAVTATDVTGEGNVDIVVANAGDATVSVFVGSGDGTFQTKVDYATGTGPRSVAAADLNGDGKADLVIADTDANTVSVLINNGDGTFATKKDYTTGLSPEAAVIADVNGDSKPDLITANHGTNTVSVLIGNGDGTFQSKVDYSVGSGVYDVVVTDANGDGKADIATSNYTASTNGVSVLLGNGNGTFQSSASYASGNGPLSVAAADVSGDGKIDLITADQDAGAVSVLLGNGNGTFQGKLDYSAVVGTRDVTTADINGDGELDIVAANFSSSDLVSIFLNTTPLSAFDTSTIASAPGADTGVVVDTVAPPLPSAPDLPAGQDTGASAYDNITSVTTPTFVGKAEVGSTVALYRDDAVLLGTKVISASGSYAITVSTPLADGRHIIYATATDAAGNRLPNTSAVSYVTIDTTIAIPAAPTLTGGSNGYTTTKTPTFTGTTEAGASVTLYDTDGATMLGTATAGANGVYSVTSSSLAEGSHTFHVAATDLAGNVSGESAGTTATVDTVAPTAPKIFYFGRKFGNGSVDSGGYDNTNEPPVTGIGDSGSTVTVYRDDAVVVGSTTVKSNGFYTVTPTSPIADGYHSFYALATDAAGNRSGLAGVSYLTIDTVTPTVTAPVLATGSDTGASSSDGITDLSNPVLTGTTEPYASVTVVDNTGIVVIVAKADANGVYKEAIYPRPDGDYTFSISVSDRAGNGSGAYNPNYHVIIDTTPPAAPSAPALATTNGATGNNRPTVTGTSDVGSTVVLYRDNGIAIGSAVATDGTYAITPTAPIADGRHQLYTLAFDVAGNRNAAPAGVTYVTVQTAPPPTPAAPTLDAGSDTGSSSSDRVTSQKAPELSGTTVAGATVKLYEIDGTTVLGTTTAKADGSYRVTSSPLSDGAHTLQVTATDAAGNASAASAGTTITIDTAAPTAPMLQLTAASDTGASSSDGITMATTPTLSGAAEGGATITLYRDDAVQIGTTMAGQDGSFTVAVGAPLSEGRHFLYATATDAAGNSSAAGGTYVTVDTTAPVVTIAGDGTQASSATQTIGGTGDPFTSVALSDNNVSVGTTTVAGNGSWSRPVTLAPGANTFVARDTDLAGNVGTSAPATYTYTPPPMAASMASMVQAMSTMGTSSASSMAAQPPAQPAENALAPGG